MVSECCNPKCRAPFVYLRDGQVFTLWRQSALAGPRVEHFWLCGSCAEHLSLEFASNGAAQIVHRSCSRTKTGRLHTKLVA